MSAFGLLFAATLLPLYHLGLAQQCAIGSENVRSRGAVGNGVTDDTDAFLRVEADGTAGVVFMPAGTYLIAKPLNLRKPVIAEKGAVFKVAAALTLINQPQAPHNTFFAGRGKVAFGAGTQYVVPEWFGAVGNGRTDDSLAIQRAYDAALAFGHAFLLLKRNYGVGNTQQLQFGPGVVIGSTPASRLTAVGGNRRGVSFTPGNHGIKSVLPHLTGFKDFCVELHGTALMGLHLRTLSGCGDAIRLLSTGAPQGAATNTVWFDKIVNSRVGIAMRASNPNCAHPGCVFQGNQFVGNAISGGPSRGAAHAILLSSPAARHPAWDRNVFDIRSITPPSNPSYSMFFCKPSCDAEVVKVGSLGPLPHPSSRVFGRSGREGKANTMQVDVRLRKQLKEHQFGLWGELNVVELSGGLTGVGRAVRCTNSPNSKRSFNGGRALVGNRHTLQVVPTSDWPPGRTRTFWFYHQLADGHMYILKCSSPRSPATKLPQFDCPQYHDNHGGSPGEVKLWVLNQSGGTVRAGEVVELSIAVNTLKDP